MVPTAISLTGVVVLLLDIFAIVSVLLGSSPVMRKITWIAIISCAANRGHAAELPDWPERSGRTRLKRA